MRRVGIAPKVLDFIKEVPFVNDWLQTLTARMNMYSGPSNPTAAEIPKNQWIVYKNTTSGEVRIWVNDNGVEKRTAALT